MSLRLKVFVYIGAFILILFFLVSSTLSVFLTNEFLELEKRELSVNTHRAYDALQNRIKDLSFKVADWAQWDETHDFVRGINDDFPETNLNPDIYKTIGINFVAITDSENSLIFKQFYDKDGNSQEFPAYIEKHFLDKTFFDSDPSLDPFIRKGIISEPEGSVILVTARTSPTSGLGEKLGSITFGYVVDNETINQVSDLTHLSLSHENFGNISLVPPWRTAKKHLYQDGQFFFPLAVNNSTISSYFLFPDIYGKPGLILKLDMGREIYSKGLHSILIFNYVMVFIGFLFMVSVFILVEYLVLKKIANLNLEVGKISQMKRLSSRLELSGKDEFSQLGMAINKMLENIEEGEGRKKKMVKEMAGLEKIVKERTAELETAKTGLEKIVKERTAELETAKTGLENAVAQRTAELQVKMDELKRTNELMIGRELKMIELKKQIEQLKKAESAKNGISTQ